MADAAAPALSLRAALDVGLSELDGRAAVPQRVVVVGAGMAGVSTAYWLGRAGNHVTVLDASPAPDVIGTAASYTGLLAPSSSFAPFFARPHLLKAQKIQFCPKTNYMVRPDQPNSVQVRRPDSADDRSSERRLTFACVPCFVSALVCCVCAQHPNLRVGLFDRGSDAAQHARQGMVDYSWRSSYRPAVSRLYGLGLWNQALVGELAKQFDATAAAATTTAAASSSSRSSLSAAASAAAPLARVDGSLAVVFDARTFQDLKGDNLTNLALVGNDAALLAPTAASTSTKVATPARKGASGSAAASAAAAPPRLHVLDDDAIVVRLPTVAPRLFSLAAVMSFEDEWALDHLAFLHAMKREAISKYAVKFLYDTKVEKFITQQQQQAATAATTGAAVVSASAPQSSGSCRVVSGVLTSRGEVVGGDAFVLCAGSQSKGLVGASTSLLPPAHKPIRTFSTKTHYLAFPNPDASAASTSTASSAPAATPAPTTASAVVASKGKPSSPSSSSSAASSSPQQLIPSVSVLLPESHLQVTPFAHEVRVSSGDDLNHFDDCDPPIVIAPAASASAPQQPQPQPQLLPEAFAPRLDAARLRSMLEDLSVLYPGVSKDVVSQGGRTVPGVALRTWSLDGQPLLGPYSAATPNLFVNGAHGNRGWTHAVAAGQHVANIISGLPTFIQQQPFDPRRFEKKQ